MRLEGDLLTRNGRTGRAGYRRKGGGGLLNRRDVCQSPAGEPSALISLVYASGGPCIFGCCVRGEGTTLPPVGARRCHAVFVRIRRVRERIRYDACGGLRHQRCVDVYHVTDEFDSFIVNF